MKKEWGLPMLCYLVCFPLILGLLLKGTYNFVYATTPYNEPRAYWIWAGIKPDKKMAGAMLYVYQGHMQKHGGRVNYERIGIAPHPLPHDIYIVYRITGSLPEPEAFLSIFQATLMQWQRHKVRVLGIQLDFDAPTSKLLSYSTFLQKFRNLLPSSYKLSITGLSDWIVFGDSTTLHEIVRATDEVVFQLYQGREHFPEIKAYLRKLCQKGIPFKIGLLANRSPESYIDQVKKYPNFKGAVIFVQKELHKQ